MAKSKSPAKSHTPPTKRRATNQKRIGARRALSQGTKRKANSLDPRSIVETLTATRNPTGATCRWSSGSKTSSAKVRSAFPNAKRSLLPIAEINDNVRRYLALKTLISLTTGVLVALWLRIIGVDYALLWGLLAFLLNYIPSIGSFIAAIPAVMLAFLQLGPGDGTLTLIGYLVINTAIGNFIEPRVMGEGMGLSTLVVFLSLIFWGWVLGPVGMLLSVPLTMILKIVLEANDDTRWMAVLLGSRPAEVVVGGAEDDPTQWVGT